MDDDTRWALAGVKELDDTTRETVVAWIERARRLAAYVRTTCPPALPPITVEVSPIERSSSRTRLTP